MADEQKGFLEKVGRAAGFYLLADADRAAKTRRLAAEAAPCKASPSTKSAIPSPGDYARLKAYRRSGFTETVLKYVEIAGRAAGFYALADADRAAKERRVTAEEAACKVKPASDVTPEVVTKQVRPADSPRPRVKPLI
jgi:hypothetical protein